MLYYFEHSFIFILFVFFFYFIFFQNLTDVSRAELFKFNGGLPQTNFLGKQ